ncbi:MAG: hypothetical protein ABI601_06635 [bacterium]
MADKYLGGIRTGSSGVSIHVLIRKKGDNSEVTGLVFNMAGLVASFCRQGGTRTAISLVTQTIGGAWTSGGFAEVDATTMPGLYRLDVPDAALVAGADFVTIAVVSTSNYTFMERIAMSSEAMQSGDSFARLGAPAGASLAADVAAVNVKTTNLPADPADASDIAAAVVAVPAAVLAAASAAPITANMTQIKGISLN